MGAAGSKPGEEGIITVHPSSSTPQQPSSSTAAGATAVSVQRESATDSLLQHLQELKANIPQLDAAINSTSKAAVRDPESLLADIEQLKQVTNDTTNLNGAITTLITGYQSWHNENVKLLTTNQEYIHRVMDQAESKADKAVRHVQLQTTRLKHLAADLKEAEALPNVLAHITATTAVLQEQLQQLEQLRVQQQQQDKTPAASSRSTSSNLLRRSPSPMGKKGQQKAQQQQEAQQQEHAD